MKLSQAPLSPGVPGSPANRAFPVLFGWEVHVFFLLWSWLQAGYLPCTLQAHLAVGWSKTQFSWENSHRDPWAHGAPGLSKLQMGSEEYLKMNLIKSSL